MWTIQLPTCSQFHAPGVVSKRDPNFPTPPSYRLASRVYTALGVSITGSYLAQRVISYIDFLRGLTPPPPLVGHRYTKFVCCFFSRRFRVGVHDQISRFSNHLPSRRIHSISSDENAAEAFFLEGLQTWSPGKPRSGRAGDDCGSHCVWFPSSVLSVALMLLIPPTKSSFGRTLGPSLKHNKKKN